MKKSTIWLIAILMVVSFFTLLFTQAYYFNQVVKMRQGQFDESVNRSMFRTVRQIEIDEVERTLSKVVLGEEYNKDSMLHQKYPETKVLHEAQSKAKYDPSIQQKTLRSSKRLGMIPQIRKTYEKQETSTILKSEISQKNYLHYKALVNEIAYHLLYENGTKNIEERLDFEEVDRLLAYFLHNNGVTIPYHLRITTSTGKEIYRCNDYDPNGDHNTYTQVLFPEETPDHMAILQIHFPEINSYIYASLKSTIPSMLLTLVLLIVFCVTMWLLIRQRRVSMMKTDFINNMTHEFKTPLSTLSLAAQMLNDPSVGKSEAMIKHITGIITDETKRLRFQVEKVLQISMFEKQGDTFKLKHLDLHELINDVVTTFRLKVESMGGEITTNLEATNFNVYADEMHITNVMFNLLDNAIKYHRPEVKPHLDIYTHNHNNRICIHIKDNGIGIKREDLKKIFDKFFRVHTGNRHDVKGFGLGLCYVKSVIKNHKGTIHAESTLGEGTTFYIELPIKNQVT